MATAAQPSFLRRRRPGWASWPPGSKLSTQALFLWQLEVAEAAGVAAPPAPPAVAARSGSVAPSDWAWWQLLEKKPTPSFFWQRGPGFYRWLERQAAALPGETPLEARLRAVCGGYASFRAACGEVVGAAERRDPPPEVLALCRDAMPEKRPYFFGQGPPAAA